MARKISSTTVDTTLLDTNIFNTITEDAVSPVLPSMGTTSTKSAGIVKLVNIFLKLLFTIKGSNYIDKNEGTFFTNLFNLNVQDIEVAQTKVQDAIDDAADQIIAIQSLQGVPVTEKLRQVYISNFEVTDTQEVLISVNLEVVSGLLTPVQLPSITLDTL